MTILPALNSTTRQSRAPRLLALAALVAAATVSACGGEGESATGNGNGYTDKDASAGGSAGQNGQGGAFIDSGTGKGGTAGGNPGDASQENCGASGLAIEAVPPDMLVVFDRSCSMRRFYNSDQPVFGTGPDDPMTRWFMARQALEQVMTTYDNKVRFGLLVFPRPYFGCGDTPTVNLMPAVSNKAAMLAALQTVQPFEVCTNGQQPMETPTGAAMNAALNAGVFTPSERDGYVLLMTDGAASCGESAASLGQTVTAIAGMGVRTAVVGFGEVVKEPAPSMLTAMGQAGGVSTAAPWYWLAQDPNALVAAIDKIVSNVISCKFKLKEAPPDPDKVYAYFDGAPIQPDGTNGWTYDAATQMVTFNGSSCQSLQSGSVKNVSIVFGCPDPSCIPANEVCDGYDNDCDGEVDETGCIN